MTPSEVATVAGLHARRILDARSLEASAARCAGDDPDRAKRASFPWPEFCALCFAAGCAAGTWFAVVVLA